jgi:hypothetical protein
LFSLLRKYEFDQNIVMQEDYTSTLSLRTNEQQRRHFQRLQHTIIRELTQIHKMK